MISIFAKHTYFLGPMDKKETWRLQRVSSRIRGEEIAKYLGAKLNQERSDVNIYIKACNYHLIKDGDYVDVLDDLWMVDWLKNRPKVKVIAMSLSHLDYLKSILKNKIVYIPHHHVNFDRVKRTRKKVTTCGYIGSPQKIEIKGFKFIYLDAYKTRKDIINFYKKIDIQVIGNVKDVPYYHPTKIINAMSFGIPTVAPKRIGYREVDGFYFQNIEELKDGWDAEKLVKEAEKYHISAVAELYRKLC